VLYIGVEYANNGSIPKRVGVWSNFWRGHHNERVGARVNSVIITAHVIGGVINSGGSSSENGAVEDADGVTVIIGERFVGVSIELSTKSPTKKVILELWNKILKKRISMLGLL